MCSSHMARPGRDIHALGASGPGLPPWLPTNDRKPSKPKLSQESHREARAPGPKLARAGLWAQDLQQQRHTLKRTLYVRGPVRRPQKLRLGEES